MSIIMVMNLSIARDHTYEFHQANCMSERMLVLAQHILLNLW